MPVGYTGDAGKSNITFDLLRHARNTPDAPALLLREGQISYRTLDQFVWALAQRLHDCGVRAGQVIGLLFTNEVALIIHMLAIARLGATGFSVPRSTTHFQRQAMAAKAGISLLATDGPENAGCGVSTLRMDLRNLLRDPVRIDGRILDPEPAAPWLIVTGSGSTGEPRLMGMPHERINARSALAASWMGITASDRIITLPHLEFTAPKHRFLEVLHAGAAFGVLPERNRDPLAICSQHRISVLDATVFHVERILASVREQNRQAGSLRLLCLVGSLVTPDLRDRIRRNLGMNLLVRYAINEAGTIAVATPPAVHDILGTVGKPLHCVELQIVDDAMRPLEAGQTGLIRLKSPGLIDGYLDDGEANRKFFRDGWFLPGDLGRMTADGQLIHLGRADQMMIFNGINIYPAEIEAVLCSHPQIRDAAALPLKSPIHQDVPVCAVCVHEGQSLSMRDLGRWATERLGFRTPRKILAVSRIPRNESGKLLRAELMELFVRDEERRRPDGAR